MTRIKFCGLSRHKEVETAAELGATHVGFVVQAPRSHRDLSTGRATELIEESSLDVRTVVVTPTDDADDLRHAADSCRPDVVQVSGDPPTDKVRGIKEETGVETWKAVTLDQADRLDEFAGVHDAIVLDAIEDGYGGHGETIDWEASREFAEKLNELELVLAGGLTPENVQAAIETVDPWGVDVSSGVETDKRKDLDRMEAFAQAVQEVDT